LLVVSQFAGTSLWFAGNAVLGDMQRLLQIDPARLSHLTSAVQFGFITGTLAFALLTVADRFSPSRVFFLCAGLGAATNAALVAAAPDFTALLAVRALTGFFLAGIYPVGMKIAADHREEGLGKALGYLVGALVVGTAFPHLLKGVVQGPDWAAVVLATSACAALGGLMVWLWVPDGPFRKKGAGLQFSAFLRVYRNSRLRAAATGYFGHMWELYTFWAFVPVMLTAYNRLHGTDLDVPLWSFLVIAIGGPGCVAGGYAAGRFGSARVAGAALAGSGLCCLISPWLFNLPASVFLAGLLFWGITVVADSPQFSGLIARAADRPLVGTALTITTCIGFAITIISIQVVRHLHSGVPENYLYQVLGLGPALGLYALIKDGLWRKTSD
jgi:predicted MFS family arabinose efflux permease